MTRPAPVSLPAPPAAGVETIAAELEALAELARRVAAGEAEAIRRLADLYVEVLRGGGKLCFVGNGGSAADAQHVAAEYMVRYGHERRALPAIALTTDTSILTACANDRGFDDVFARQVEALCGPTDLLVLHSTTGASANLVRAAQAARRRGARTVALLGRDGGALRDAVDLALVVPSDDTARVQELHLAIEHVVCGIVERELTPP